MSRDFPGSPVVKTLHSQCRRRGFDPWSGNYALCLVAQSYLTLCDPVNCSPPGSSVHGILQARILEWSILKEISPEYSLEGLVLKLKFQYFGHLM